MGGRGPGWEIPSRRFEVLHFVHSRPVPVEAVQVFEGPDNPYGLYLHFVVYMESLTYGEVLIVCQCVYTFQEPHTGCFTCTRSIRAQCLAVAEMRGTSCPLWVPLLLHGNWMLASNWQGMWPSLQMDS